MADDDVEQVQLEINTLVTTKSQKFRVVNKIGEGGFGALYTVNDEATGTLWAMKCEPESDDQRVLKIEVQVLRALKKINARHACNILCKGKFSNFNFVVMTLLGKSISDYRKQQNRQRFTLSTTLRIGVQSLEAIEDLHKVHFLHRDLKPANFTTGREELNELGKIYMIDFGMARKYRNSAGDLKYPRTSAYFRGTIRYAPLSTHERKEMSRKDDIETWLYMLVEMTVGKLPWTTISDRDQVKDYKMAIRQGNSCPRKKLFNGTPKEYETMLNYINSLQYWDAPDYKYLYELVDVIYAVKYGKKMKDDNRGMDWEPTKAAQSKEASTAHITASKSKSMSKGDLPKPVNKTTGQTPSTKPTIHKQL